MKYFNWETKKVWKKNSIILFLILTIILSSAYFILTFERNNPLNEAVTQNFSLPSDFEFREKTVNDHFTQEEQEKMIFLHNEIRQFETGTYDDEDDRMIELYKQADNQKNADVLPAWMISILSTNYYNTLFRDSMGWSYKIEETTQQLGRAQIEYLQQEEIEPRKPLRYPQSEMDRQQTLERIEQLFGEEQANARIYTDYHGSRFDKGWYKIWQAIIDQIYWVLMALLIFLFGGLLAIENSTKHNHYRLLLSEGISTRTIFLSKFSISFFSGLLFLGLSLVSILVTSLFFNGLGSLDYPVLFHFYENGQVLPDEGASYFLHESFVDNQTGLGLNSISLGRYLLHSITLFLVIFLFLLAATYLFSNFIQNESLVSLLGISLIGMSFLLPISPYNPLSYFDINKVVNGSIRLELETNQMSYEMGMRVLLIWSLLLFLVAYFIQIRRQPKRVQRGSRE